MAASRTGPSCSAARTRSTRATTRYRGPRTPRSSTSRSTTSANEAYAKIRLYRATSPSGPFTQVGLFSSPAFGGLYRDSGLSNGTTYWYKLQGVDLAGHPSTFSPVFSGKARRRPLAPIGHVTIDKDRPFTASTAVQLQLGTDRGAKSVKIANEPTFAGSVWKPMSATKPWTIAPDAN